MAISPAPPPPGTQAWPMDQVPDPEVPERPTRRRFAAAYKAAILDELDRAIEPGAKGAWGSETPIRSRRGAVILVDEPAEQVPPANVARVGRDRLPGRYER